LNLPFKSGDLPAFLCIPIKTDYGSHDYGHTPDY
jgi:hypothetical protein